jgi:hypothetical protein
LIELLICRSIHRSNYGSDYGSSYRSNYSSILEEFREALIGVTKEVFRMDFQESIPKSAQGNYL